METKNKKLPVGIEMFHDIREHDFYYIDKTGFIKELLESWTEVNLFTRPRRFGKSLNMDMLKAFFEIGTDKRLFDGLEISAEKQICEEYIHNYITNEVTELEELMEIKQLIQRQKLERMIKVHKEMRGLDRYREQPKEYKYHDPYDDWIFRQLADIDNRNNIPDTSPQVDFNEGDYEDYLKAKWNRGL